jgi:hypothetical protein
LFNDTYLIEELYVLLNGRVAMNDELQKMGEEAAEVYGNVLFRVCFKMLKKH